MKFRCQNICVCHRIYLSLSTHEDKSYCGRFHLVGENGHAFLIVIYTACYGLATWLGLFLGTSHFDLEGGRSIPPLEFVGGGAFPLELQISLKNLISVNS